MTGRRIALLLGILLSGGMLILPRIPLLVLLFIFSFAATGFRGIPLSTTKKVWLLLGIIFLASVIRPGPIDLESLFVRYANFLGGLCLLAVYLRGGYSKLYQDLFAFLPWMAIQAILTFVMANWVPSIFVDVNLPSEGSFSTFLFLLNYHVLLEDFSGFIRPNGFFWEPGVFQVYINLYLYLALFVFNDRRHAILALLAIACIYSTTGVIIASLLLAVAFKEKFSSGGRRQRAMVLCVGLLAAPFIFAFAAKNINEKITGEMQGSSLIRQYDVLVGLDIIKSYPVLGIGFDHARYQTLAPNYTLPEDVLGLASTPERSTSNGIVYLGYTLGVPLALVFIFGIFRQNVFGKKMLVGGILFISMLGESLIFTPFFLMLIFSGLVSIQNQSSKTMHVRLAGGAS
jgi:hypothetical protein